VAPLQSIDAFPKTGPAVDGEFGILGKPTAELTALPAMVEYSAARCAKIHPPVFDKDERMRVGIKRDLSKPRPLR
jgi:hypothetical protein